MNSTTPEQIAKEIADVWTPSITYDEFVVAITPIIIVALETSTPEQCPDDLIAFKWAETLSTGCQSVLLAGDIKRLQDAITTAIKNERERAAKIADAEAQAATRDEALSNDDGDRGRCEAARNIATAIREGK